MVEVFGDIWRPIETAPKDGRRILLTWCRLQHAKNSWGTVRIGKWSGSQWALDMAGHFRLDCTHWMPLPEPPQPEGRVGAPGTTHSDISRGVQRS